MTSPAAAKPESEAVSRRMARTGPRDTSPELRLRRLLHARGLRYRVDHPVLKGSRRRADIVFTRWRLAIFVDGCFWHGCPEHATWPKRNATFWREKIETNRARDADTDERLMALGWQVVRIWEHEDADAAAERIAAIIQATESEGTT